MKQKNSKISPLEAVVLLLTALFAAGTLLWFHLMEPTDGLTFVETSRMETAETEPEPEPEAPGMLAGEVLDLNTAPLSDLIRLPGIGEKKAEAIIAWRTEHGSFSSVEELIKVKGIGEKILQKLRPFVTVGYNAEN